MSTRRLYNATMSTLTQHSHMMYCREYLHRFLRLPQCHRFQQWYWCWPGQHQPLYSIMALIQELEDHPFDAHAEETRRLIGLAIDMCGHQSNGGIVATEEGDPIPRPLHEGGTEAWTFIRRASERAWVSLMCAIFLWDMICQIHDLDGPQADLKLGKSWHRSKFAPLSPKC